MKTRLLAFCIATIMAGTLLVASGQHVARNARLTQSQTQSDEQVVRGYQQMIKPTNLAARLYFIASDGFEGRETTTRGQKLAAQYLASQYRQLGLSPYGTEKASDPLSPTAYFQTFSVYGRNAKQSRLELTVDDRVIVSSTSAAARDDLSFFSGGALAAADPAPIVFVGYGIADDKLKYDDYAALSAKGSSVNDKWVLILDDEPLANASTSLLPTLEHKPSRWSTQFINKKSALWAAGRPKGVLVVSNVSPRSAETFAALSQQAVRNAQRVGTLSLTESPSFPPTFDISSKLANQLLSKSGTSVEELKKQIDQSLKPVVFDLDQKVRAKATVEANEGLKTENVLAYIEGTDPKLKDEVLIISAHYDHLGLNPALKGDQIFNGAADDGSGVVATLELASIFMSAKREGAGPRRSILFVNFSGEEKGLLGSTYYSRNPAVPWDKTVADINLDGVASFDDKHATNKDYIYIVGTESLSRELVDLTKSVNQSTGTNLTLAEGQRFGSDHTNFETQLIPYLYFSTGLTEKYHQPGDEPNTIDYNHFAKVVQLVFATTWRVANQDSKPAKLQRSQLTLVGYTCPPCPFECDEEVFDHPGECPVCGMALAPKYKS
jgi:hypothetical protein